MLTPSATTLHVARVLAVVPEVAVAAVVTTFDAETMAGAGLFHWVPSQTRSRLLES